MPDTTTTAKTSPATLVAILVAARRSGDRELERHARQQLLEQHHVKLTFTRPAADPEGNTDG